MSKGFDRLAGFYDTLERIVFGRTLLLAQSHHLDYLATSRKILFAGPGTGKLLDLVLQYAPEASIACVDSSSRMLQRCLQVCTSPDRVDFINKDLLEYHEGGFDAVITFFFLDVFNENGLRSVTRHIAEISNKESIWLYADFQRTVRPVDRTMTWLMYRFFNYTTCMEGSRLLDHTQWIKEVGFYPIEETAFRNGFIKSGVYHRINGSVAGLPFD